MIRRLVVAVSLVAVSLAAVAQDVEAEKQSMLSEVDRLLNMVEGNVLGELETQAQEAEEEVETAAGDATGDARREAELRRVEEEMQFRRQSLLRQVEDWARSDEVIIALLETEELQEAMEKARAIAEYYGLDVEKLGKLYELGKKTIRQAGFELPDRIPPDKNERYLDENYIPYFSRFFSFAHTREEEIAKFREQTQEYKVVLYKRVTLAYIRTLLLSGEQLEPCQFDDTAQTVEVAQSRLKSLNCKDPVVDQLRRYVSAVQMLASAEADTFIAEAENVVAEQQLIGDLVAGIPLVGDAIDFYSLYSGEDLSGQCLSRTSLAITAVFSIIPFIPASWFTQAIKRFGLEDHVARLLTWAAESAEWSAGQIQGLARWAGISPEWVRKVQAALMTEINVTANGIEIAPGRAGRISQSHRQKVDEALGMNGTVARNTEMAMEGQVLMRNLTPEIRNKMEATSNRIMSRNLDAVPANARAAAGDFDGVVDASNMVPEHLEAFHRLSKEKDSVIIFRSVNEDAAQRIAENFPTKWMDVKGKSADWGPQRAFIPVDQKFSKLGNPNKSIGPDELAEIADYYKKVDNCVSSGKCAKVELTLSDGNSVHVLKNPDGTEVPVLRDPGGVYRNSDTGAVIDVTGGTVTPMEVLAGKTPDGKLVPLTADYDLMAVGSRSDVTTSQASKTEGFITAEERALNADINKAGREAGYEGGNLVHHGPENQYFDSPGALSNDPEITVIDPQKGMKTIPRCDVDCMKKWCQSSGQCGGLPICATDAASPPCIFVDPDRLFKDYMHDARLRGYTNLRPNSAWNWGDVNGLSGWTPLVVLDGSAQKPKNWKFGQYIPGEGVMDTLNKIKFERLSRPLKAIAGNAMDYLFSCPDSPSIRDRVWDLSAGPG